MTDPPSPTPTTRSPERWSGTPRRTRQSAGTCRGYNIFCAGYTQLADGNVLVAGGNKDSSLNGIVQTHIFDWRTETWSRGPDMAAGRWYPSVAALGNDEAVIVGGGPTVPEVYQTDGSLRRLTSASGYGDRSYPFLALRPDGKVELVGPTNTMNTIDTSGAGAHHGRSIANGVNRSYGSYADLRHRQGARRRRREPDRERAEQRPHKNCGCSSTSTAPPA